MTAVARRRAAAVLAFLLLAGCASPVPAPTASPSAPPSVPPSPTATPASSPTPSPTTLPTATLAPDPTNPPTAKSGGFTWRRVNEPAGVLFTRVIPDGNGFLAVASNDSSPDTDYAPTFWRSTNGLSWRQVKLSSLDPFVPKQPDRYVYVISSLVRVGQAIVAVGDRLLSDASAGDAAMWYSPDDGATWQRVASGGSFPDAYVYDVTAGPSGFVAVGSDGYPGASTQDTGTRGAAVWTSPDGARWTRVHAQSAFAGGFMTRVIATGTGYIASGRVHTAPTTGGAAPRPPIWTSTDGQTWHRAPRSTSLATADYVAVSAAPVGYVAIGTITDPAAGSLNGAAWWSTAGTSWKRASSGPGPGYFASVVPVAGGLVAVGNGAGPPESATPTVAAWTSTDGHAWQAIPTIPGFSAATVIDAASNAGRIVVLGESADPNTAGTTGFVWLAVPN